MPSARLGAAPLSRAQADIANKICKSRFRHELGPSQWDKEKKQQLVQDINAAFVRKGMDTLYNMDKLEMWQGNSLYRWRCKQREQRPNSWHIKARSRREATAKGVLAENQSRRQPDESPLKKSKRQEAEEPHTPPAGPEEPELDALPWDTDVTSSASTCATPTMMQRQVTPALLPITQQRLPTKRLPPVSLVRVSSATAGTDWWLPYRPSEVPPVTPGLDSMSGVSLKRQGEPAGNRTAAHVPAFPETVCRVTRPLATLLDLHEAEKQAHGGGGGGAAKMEPVLRKSAASAARDTVGCLR